MNIQRFQDPVPKICGADCELSNFIVGPGAGEWTGRDASHFLLERIDGVQTDRGRKRWSWITSYSNPQDCGRRWLVSNGGCVYIDLEHLEICLPEVRSASEHLAAWHAMLRLVDAARCAVEPNLPPGQRLCVAACNSDGLGHSWGSHLNVLTNRQTWERIVHRWPHYLLFLASYQASSIVFTGQGKVGGENGHGFTPFQLSQRADFIETMVGVQTTYRRPMINARDEALCGSDPGNQLARLHCIFYDSNLCHVAHYLKVGGLQIVMSMLEHGDLSLDPLLEDVLQSLHCWSSDSSLKHRERTVSGTRWTALEMQECYLDLAKRFVDSGRSEGLVPEAKKILALWEETLRALRSEDYDGLSTKLDWVLKRHLIERTMAARPDLSWDSCKVKEIDHLYGNLNPSDGLFRSMEDAGHVYEIVTQEEIARFQTEPPTDTRAYARTQILRGLEEACISHIDWDRITVRESGGWRRGKRETYCLGDPTDRGNVVSDSPADRLVPVAATSKDEVSSVVRTNPKEDASC